MESGSRADAPRVVVRWWPPAADEYRVVEVTLRSCGCPRREYRRLGMSIASTMRVGETTTKLILLRGSGLVMLDMESTL